MLPAVAKYAHESQQPGQHPGPISYPGKDGIPFLGETVPDLHPHELEKLPLIGHKKVQQFDLSDPEQLKLYTAVLDHVRNGAYTLDYIYRHPIEYDDNGVRKLKIIAHAEWTQLYYVMPPNRGNGNGRPGNFTMR